MTVITLKKGPEAETEAQRLRFYTPTRPAFPFALHAPQTDELVRVRRVKSAVARAAITNGLASAVAHCRALGAPVTVHSCFVRVARNGGVMLGVDGESPDTRFCSPTGAECVFWAIGSVLHKLITGRAPVPFECTPHERAQFIAKCIGTPDLGECARLGIDYSLLRGPQELGQTEHERAHAPRALPPSRVRRRVPSATPCESRVMRVALTWIPATELECSSHGLRFVVDAIAE
jgi:hypothetical protein